MHGKPKNEYTQIESDVIVCNDCGAFAASEKAVKHFKSCKAGECARWEKIYANESDD